MEIRICMYNVGRKYVDRNKSGFRRFEIFLNPANRLSLSTTGADTSPSSLFETIVTFINLFSCR